jgi:hypothetical protein
LPNDRHVDFEDWLRLKKFFVRQIGDQFPSGDTHYVALSHDFARLLNTINYPRIENRFHARHTASNSATCLQDDFCYDEGLFNSACDASFRRALTLKSQYTLLTPMGAKSILAGAHLKRRFKNAKTPWRL